MNVKIHKSKAVGKIKVPSSKSMAHRYLICAGMCRGESEISGVDLNEDVLATIDCMKNIGAQCEICGDTVKVKSNFGISGGTVCCRESGSTLRFFIPIFLSGNTSVTMTGYGRLFSRPLGTYEDICKEQGLGFDLTENSLTVCGGLKSGEFNIPGDISSQFVSGLLFALPTLNGDSVINFTTPPESVPYIKMTMDVLENFGIITEFCRDKIYTRGNQKYLPHSGIVEGDYSNSAFLHAFNLVGGDVSAEGLNIGSLQGDKIYLKYFDEISKGTPTLDIKDTPDLAPVLITLMALCGGGKLTGTKRLKIKESDRGAAMKAELEKFGADITLYDNEIEVKKSQLHKPNDVLLSHGDHRIVMSLAVISSVYGGEISGAENVSKSYPKFFDDISSLGIEVEFIDK